MSLCGTNLLKSSVSVSRNEVTMKSKECHIIRHYFKSSSKKAFSRMFLYDASFLHVHQFTCRFLWHFLSNNVCCFVCLIHLTVTLEAIGSKCGKALVQIKSITSPGFFGYAQSELSAQSQTTPYTLPLHPKKVNVCILL